jgi:aspartyl-tRNA(Asn)/glutamyl-tRNA(Gln) amidotransferase subunit C
MIIMPDRKTVEKVAEIARLSLSDKELDEMAKDLESILSAFRELEKADTGNAKPSFQPIEMKNVLREDRVEKSISQAEALKNAKQKEKGFFKGPRAI